MHRLPVALARFLFVMFIGAVATVLGTVLALGGTRSGRSLLAEVVTARSAALVHGSISIGRIEGNFFTWLTLDSVVVRDTSGFPLASAARVELRFQLANLIGKRVVFDRIALTRPRIFLEKHRNGRMNFEEVMRIGEGPPGPAWPGHADRFPGCDDPRWNPDRAHALVGAGPPAGPAFGRLRARRAAAGPGAPDRGRR